jgi:hypothetical protein
MFGYIAYVYVLDKKRSKLDPKAKKCIFIGYSLEKKKIYMFQMSRNVVFDEMVNWYSPLKI